MKRVRRIMLALISCICIVVCIGCGQKQAIQNPELSKGSEAPDFKIELNDGSIFSLSENEGRVVLLNFWATWCSACVNEMPALEKLYEEYGDKIQIIAVNTAESKETADQFIEKQNYHFPVGYVEDSEVSSKYPSVGIPYTLIIGKDGRVTAVFVGAQNADKQYKIYKQALSEAYGQ